MPKEQSQWLNLDELVQEMFSAQAASGPADLRVWGGVLAADRLEAFWQAWKLPCQDMPWSLWQWTDEIQLLHQAGLPENTDYLERGRIFGPKGDLELRRSRARRLEGKRLGEESGQPQSGCSLAPEEECFLWRYVGEAVVELPAEFEPEDYWKGQPAGWRLRPRQRRALLWGEYVPAAERWHDDRVGKARLVYPPLQGTSVVQMRYIEYLHGGNVELVRLTGLEKGPDRNKEAK